MIIMIAKGTTGKAQGSAEVAVCGTAGFWCFCPSHVSQVCAGSCPLHGSLMPVGAQSFGGKDVSV